MPAKELAIESGKALAPAVGHITTTTAVSTGITAYIFKNPEMITVFISAISAMIGAWYYINIIRMRKKELKLKVRELDQADKQLEDRIRLQRNREILNQIAQAPENIRPLLEKHLDI